MKIKDQELSLITTTFGREKFENELMFTEGQVDLTKHQLTNETAEGAVLRTSA